LNSEFQAFLDAVDAAHDERMVSQATKAFAASIGFERFAYLQTEGFDIKTINTYPLPWAATYIEQRFAIIDPVVIEAKRRMKPFFWSADDWPARGSSELRRFRDDAISHGIRSGTTIPVRGSFGSTVMLTFASSEAREHDSLGLDPELAVQAALAIHYRLRFLSAGRVLTPDRVFSSKEAVCVTWSAKGKKANEISSIMGISERTVQHYLDSARQKLRAETVQHLTALATARGMIEF
jgi:LuxR family transcriptional activator of conjugal transfer of Ti plasmids